MLKLYYFPLSPYSQKALIALEEKGARYEIVPVSLADPAGREAYEKINPFGKVPFLRDEARDWSVPESSIIIEYVDQHVAGGTPLIPADRDQARQARFHDRVFDLYIAEQALKIFFDGRRPAEKRDPFGVEQAEKRLFKTYAMLDEYLARRRWVMGETFTIGDVAAAPALAVANAQRPFAAHAHLTAYFARLNERPSVQRAFRLAAEFLATR
jgi:glutathione S-transferase